jgi:ABC-type nitrate/sulfonate/bicarbonate transport system substrate-binding protein
MNHHARRMSVISALALLSLTAVACSSSPSSTSGGGTSGGLVNVKLGMPLVNAEVVPIWYGTEKGIFKKYGLNVTVSALGSDAVINSALASGSIDVAQETADSAMAGIQKGVPIISVAQYTNATPAELIANNSWAKAHNLTAATPVKTIVHDLVGATVGSSSPSIVEHENVLLKSEGVNPSSVHEETISSEPAEQALLVANKLDAFIAGPPLPNELAASNQGTLLISEGTASVWSHSGINLAMVARASWATSNKKVLEDLISAMQASVQALLADPSASLSVAEKNLPGTSAKTLLDSYPLEGFTTCPAQTSAAWAEDVSVGILGGQLPSGSVATEGKIWTNAYIRSTC